MSFLAFLWRTNGDPPEEVANTANDTRAASWRCVTRAHREEEFDILG